jgi:hypothetical protein
VENLGFICIYFFHANEFQVMISLGIISVGLALINTIAMNMILLLTPKQFGGVVIGIVQVFMFTGMAIGPVTSSLYLQSYQTLFVMNKNVHYFHQAIHLILFSSLLQRYLLHS